MTGGGGQIQVVQVRGELDLALADSLAGVSFCDAAGSARWSGSLITPTGPGAVMASSRRSRRW